MVREPDATIQPTLQANQLMPKHGVLSLKPQLRPEWRGQDGQSETEQPDHSASLCDSITSSTQIRFSVHTPSSRRRSEDYCDRCSSFVLSCIGITKTNQLHQFLRVEFIHARAVSILL